MLERQTLSTVCEDRKTQTPSSLADMMPLVAGVELPDTNFSGSSISDLTAVFLDREIPMKPVAEIWKHNNMKNPGI